MPHNNHTGGSGGGSGSGGGGASGGGQTADDLGSTDEVKVFKDEGDGDEEKTSENLLEEKSSLINLTESEEKSSKNTSRQDHSPVFGKVEPHTSSFNMGYLVSPYSYTNGSASALPVSMANKMALSPFFCHNGDHLTTPPPAHCGIPPYQLDPKTMSLTRPAIYPFPTSQYAYPMLSPDMSQVPSWHTPTVYSAASGFRNPYPSSLPINTTLPSDFYRFSSSLSLPSVHAHHHVLNSHPAIVTPGPKQEIGPETNHRYGRTTQDQKNSPAIQTDSKESNDKKKPHIKKPLNAFMLYMKEMRAKVVAECTLKESAAINQILGRRWHSLSREEQNKYYEKARQERQAHMELYPGWSARDNYGYGSKKKKRKKDRSPADSGGNNMKKCRARYGLDQQNQWCKPCRRKKKCIRYMESESDEQQDIDTNMIMDDNLGSCGSVDEAQTPEDDSESINQSLSSPGGLSALSSLQSPSTSLASPLNLLASPSTPNQMNHNSLDAHQITNGGVTGGNGGGSSGSGIQSFMVINDSSAIYNSKTSQMINSVGSVKNNSHSSSSSSSSSSCSNGKTLNNNNNSDSSNKNRNSGGNNTTLNEFGLIKNEISNPLTSTLDNKCGIIASTGNPLLSPVLSPTTDTIVGSSSFFNPKSIKVEQTTASSSVGGGKMFVHTASHMHPNHILSPHSAHLDNFYEKVVRNPVGANPRDINNPLSVNQLTKRDYVNHNSPVMSHHHMLGGGRNSPSISASSSPILTSVASSSSSLSTTKSATSTVAAAAAAAALAVSSTALQYLQQTQLEQQQQPQHLHSLAALNHNIGMMHQQPSPSQFHHHRHHHLAAAVAASAAAAAHHHHHHHHHHHFPVVNSGAHFNPHHHQQSVAAISSPSETSGTVSVTTKNATQTHRTPAVSDGDTGAAITVT